MKHVQIFSDGSCLGNPGKGGYGAILRYNEHEREISAGYALTTNNRMELMAVIVGLEKTAENAKVKVYSDSAYVVNAFNQNWLANWKKNGWRTSGGSDVLNSDLWKELDSLATARKVEFMKVKGHSDNILNNRCDQLATAYYKLYF